MHKEVIISISSLFSISVADQKTVNVTDIDDFMADIEQSVGGKSARYDGKIQKDISPETVYQALLNR